ncbi:MFS transporter [Staphylococcus aureus]
MINQSIWRSNFRILWLSQFIAIAGLTVLVPLLPIYMASLQNLSVVEIQLWSGIAIAAPAVTTMIASPIWGKLGDKISRKWMVLRALLDFGGMLIFNGIVSDTTVCTCRVLSQLVVLLMHQVRFASAEAPAEDRGKVLGRLQSSVSAGSLVGAINWRCYSFDIRF